MITIVRHSKEERKRLPFVKFYKVTYNGCPTVVDPTGMLSGFQLGFTFFWFTLVYSRMTASF